MTALLIKLLIIVHGVSISTQNSIITNYTRQLLRQAKTAELMSYQGNENFICSNFYQRVCGNWKKAFPATSDNPKTSHLGQIHNLYVSKSRDLLKAYQGLDVSHDLISKLYRSCVNKSEIEKKGIAPVLNHLTFEGGWPVIKNSLWYESEYDWLKVVADIRRDLNLNLFIGLELKPENGIKRIEISAPKLPLITKSKYLDSAYEDERNHYKNKITKNLQKYFCNMTTVWCQEVAEQVLNVEISLAKGLPNNEKPTAAELKKLQTVAQLKAKYATYVDFNRYLTLIFDRTINEPIYELSSDYFSNLVQIIEHTPKLNIANYTIWRVLDHLGFIPDKSEADYEIWCTEKVVKHFPNHVASLYLKEFKAKAADRTGTLINKIFSDIKRALEIKFGKEENFSWMSKETRQKANENFGRLVFPVADYVALEKYLKDILHEIKNDQYYENLLEILKFETKKELETNINYNNLYQSNDSTSTNTPHYSSKHNEIIIPIEFIQSHFLFDPEYPNAINYGTIGVLLAQQLLRGLLNDESARKWWDNATEDAFKARKDCFVKQLGNYKFQGKSVDDKDGVLKFIINTGALEIAFDAYTAWLKQEGIDRPAENLSSQYSYADERLFFWSFGQMYCADYYLLSFKSLNELPERLLVNGALMNFAKFGEYFECATSTKMNPKNKCTIF